MKRFALLLPHFATALSVVATSCRAPGSGIRHPPKKIKDTGSITLGHRESSIPPSYYDDKQQVIGYCMN